MLAKKRPDLAVKSKKTGGNWKDNKKAMYTNPYNHEVWEYLVQVAEDAARHGFREIQFDYVRFPSDGDRRTPSIRGRYLPKEDAIAGFLAYARPRLEKLGVWVSADVFGVILQVKDDAGIGQKAREDGGQRRHRLSHGLPVALRDGQLRVHQPQCQPLRAS